MGTPEDYLSERGILESTGAACGLDLLIGADLTKVHTLLGFGSNGTQPLNWPNPAWAICFPLIDAAGNVISYSARVHPPALFGAEHREAKFVHTAGLPTRPFITWPTWAVAKRTDVRLLITEGPTRGLISYQCGVCAIALTGVWNIADKRKTDDEKLVLHSTLRQFSWTNRETVLAFDRDVCNEEVLHAVIRNILLLHLAGAVVKTIEWDPQYKGLDDYVMFKAGSDPTLQTEVLNELLGNAKDAFEFFAPQYLHLVCRELDTIAMSEAARSQLANLLHDRLNVAASALRREEPKQAEKEKSRVAVFVDETEPGHNAINDGADLLDRIQAAVARHIVMDEHDRVAVTLWIVLDFLTSGFYTVPYLTVHSPIKRCGKTNLLIVLRHLGWNTALITNITTAAMFRVVDEFAPTLLIDEAETFLKKNEELRGILNAGHKRADAYVLRFNNDLGKTERFSTFCPKVIALIGKLHETLADRSIILNLRRRLKTEKITPIRYLDSEALKTLKSDIVRWCKDNGKKIWQARPAVPETLNDRAAENWEPLMAIAQIAGGDWPKKARDAALAKGLTEDEADSVILYLLRSLRTIWDNPDVKKLDDGDFIRTPDLLCMLNDDETAPWADWKKGDVKRLSARKLSNLLREYSVHAERLQVARGDNPHGYRLSKLQPLFDRYLDEEPPPEDSPNGSGQKPPKAGPSPGSPKTGAPTSDPQTSTTTSTKESDLEKKGYTSTDQSSCNVAGDANPSAPEFYVQLHCLNQSSCNEVAPELQPDSGDDSKQSHLKSTASTTSEDCNVIHPSEQLDCNFTATTLDESKQLHLKSTGSTTYGACNCIETDFRGKYPLFFIDTETYGPWPSEHELTGNLRKLKREGAAHPDALDWRKARIRLVTISDGDNLTTFDLFDNPLPEQIRYGIANFELVGHNLAFDLAMLRKEGIQTSIRVWDTMIASRLLNAGLLPSSASPSSEDETDVASNDLGSLIHRYLQIDLDKTDGASDWGVRQLRTKQLAYARNDVVHLPKLKELLTIELEKAELTKVFELEMRLLPILVDIKLAGIHVDRDRLSLLLMNTGALETDARAKALDLLKESTEFANMLEFERRQQPSKRKRELVSAPNIRSQHQLIPLFKGLGVTLVNTQKETLQKIKHPAAALVLQYHKAAAEKTKLEAMLQLSDNPENRIYAPVWGQIAADTGRIHTSSIKGQLSPAFNFQNPTKGEHRSIFTAAPDCQLIIADFEQIEIRIIAEITGDPELISMLQAGVDVYVFAAAMILEKERSEISATDRQLAKSLTLAINYGMGPETFRHDVDEQFGIELSQAQVQKMLDKFFELFKGIAVFHERAEVSVETATYVRTIPLGRRRWLPETLYWNKKRKLLINTPVQASATDCFKLAVVKVAQVIPIKAHIVNLLHDEIIVETPALRSAITAELVEHAMTAAYTELFGTRIPLKVKTKISNSWAEK
jgi:putative DNA primase/helicase